MKAMTSKEISAIVESCIREEIKEPERLQEFSAGVVKALKIVGGTVATYYIFKSLIHGILTDDKFIVGFSKKVADRLEYLELRAAEREKREAKHKI